MRIIQTSIPDLLILEPKVFGDERGFFMETYQARQFSELGLPTHFVQDNHSGSRQGTLRGLHYQIRQAQGKLVRVVSGEIFDIAVDLRKSSPSFGKWVGATLSTQNKHLFWIPAGFAHGFYVLSDWAEIVYKATDYYAPAWERTILWNDPDLAITWPLIDQLPPVLSAKDGAGLRFSTAETY
ncbi:MAG: dTDP-4-dehydrorhamnose 3,5-epimerase [Chloroflexi bacterium]|nr:dTDP-4-dehydrorhamnose 3,5-epimerase [Chloroflexota bacterium]